MQRRATAIYATFFFVIAIGSYAGLGVVSQPALSIDDPDHTLSVNDTFSVDGRTYTVTAIAGQADSNGNVQRSGTVEWVNDSATYSADWTNNSTFERGGQSYYVLVNTSADPSTVTLERERNRTAVLVNDSTVQNELVTADGAEYVVRGENESRQLIPATTYFETPPRQTYTDGASFAFHGNETTITEITNQSVTVQWTAPRVNAVELGQTETLKTTVVRGGMPTDRSLAAGTNVTLNGETFAVHYPDNETALLASNPDAYQESIVDIEHLFGQIRGLWAVIVMSSLTGLVLISLGQLPRRG